MATRPTVVPQWATAVTPSAPSAGALQTGHVPGAAANPDHVNYVEKYTSEWATYLSELSPLSNVISGDSSLTLIGGTADADRVRISLSNDALILNHGDIAAPNFSVWLPTIGWVHTRAGHIATVGTVDDGYRWGYSSTVAVSSTYLPSATPLVLEHHLADGTGGWAPSFTGVEGPVYQPADRYLGFLHAEASAVQWYRDLAGVLTGHNAEAKTAGGTVMVLNRIAARIDTSGGGGATTIKLVQVTRSSNAETVLGTLSAPATTAAADYSATFSATVDLSLYSYLLRVEIDSSGGLAAVRDLTLRVDKYAVE